jgi:hypothetical protein
MKPAILILFIATLMTVSYGEGRVAEHARIESERDAMIDACREDNVILQRRYDSLASESDWLTTVSAEAKYQGGGQ